jgi:hypothetical protein
MPDDKSAKATAAVEALCEYIIAWSHGGPRLPETKTSHDRAVIAMTAALGGKAAKPVKVKKAKAVRRKK